MGKASVYVSVGNTVNKCHIVYINTVISVRTLFMEPLRLTKTEHERML